METPYYMPSSFSSPISTQLPFSDGSLHSTLRLLDALDEFYRNQRLWIEQTRVALDHAFDQSEYTSTHLNSPLPSPPISESGLRGRSESPQRVTRPSLDGARRKKSLQLALDIHNDPQLHKRIRRITSRKDLDQRKRMLDMLDEIAQARMESCRFTYRMVRNTNRMDVRMDVYSLSRRSI